MDTADKTAAEMNIDNSILRKAHDIIYGDREKTYGNPAKNLAVIAEFWTTYLHAVGVATNITLTAENVCVMMVLLKTARLSNTIDHVDSQIDSCGYMALLERVQDWNKKPVDPSNSKEDGRVLVNCVKRQDGRQCAYPKCGCDFVVWK